MEYCVEQSPVNKRRLKRAKVGLSPFSLGKKEYYLLSVEAIEKLKKKGFSFSNRRQTRYENVMSAHIKPPASRTATKKKREKRDERWENMKKLYVDAVVAKRVKARSDAIAEVRKNERYLDNLQKEMAHLQRELYLKRMAKKKDSGAKDKAKEKFMLEFQKLQNSKKVESIDFNGNKLVARTDTLYCVDPRTRLEHEIGKMEIEVNCRSYGVRISNLTRQVPGNSGEHHAPYVNGNGFICEANFRDVLRQLWAEFDYVNIILMSIQFVENVHATNDVWGCDIDKWPVK